MMPSGGGYLVPRSEPTWPSAAGLAKGLPPPKKGLPRSEVVKRAPVAVKQEYDHSAEDALEHEATEILCSNCGPVFYVDINRTTGQSLGIEVEHYTPRVLIVMTVNGGLIQDWNTANPEATVEEQDLIVGANDVEGDVEKILNECRQLQPIKLAVRRPLMKIRKLKTLETEFKISLDKQEGSKLGIDVNHEDGKELFIESIDEGLVKTWNDEHPDTQVHIEDRIIEVNGVKGDVKRLLEACMKNEMLEMTLIRSELQEE